MSRIPEESLLIPALQAAANSPNGEIKTSELIKVLTDKFNPKGKDAEILENRNDSRFSQKVRNIISHRNNETSMFNSGYVEYKKELSGIKITQSGRDLLKNFNIKTS